MTDDEIVEALKVEILRAAMFLHGDPRAKRPEGVIRIGKSQAMALQRLPAYAPVGSPAGLKSLFPGLKEKTR